MDSIYIHSDFLRVYKTIIEATQDIAVWLRSNSRTANFIKLVL